MVSKDKTAVTWGVIVGGPVVGLGVGLGLLFGPRETVVRSVSEEWVLAKRALFPGLASDTATIRLSEVAGPR